MLIWTAMLVPVFAAVVLLVFFGRKTVWWEFTLPFLVSVICILVGKMIAISVATSATEFWGSAAMDAVYYEAWNEKVSCRHPVYCTRPVTKHKKVTHWTGTGENRRSYETSEPYIDNERYRCGWEHSYDVDEHAPYWEIHDTLGKTFNTGNGQFDTLAARWKNKNFVDLRRSYHTINGNKYVTNWDRRDETLEPIVTSHTYTNRAQVSTEYKFKEVTPENKVRLGLYDYPAISTYSPSILGTGPNVETANRYLDIWNAKLGPQKQVRMWVLIFPDKPLESGIMQEAFWKGGQKNEVVVCIGTDKQWNVTWSKVFSWTKKTDMIESLNNRIAGAESNALDLNSVARVIVEDVSKGFVRREFKEFDCLTVEPSGWAIFWTFVVTILVNIGVSLYVVGNEFNNERAEGKSERFYRFHGMR